MNKIILGVFGAGLLAVLLLWLPAKNPVKKPTDQIRQQIPTSQAQVELPIEWGDMGERLVAAGVIRKDEYEKRSLNTLDNQPPVMNAQNASAWLTILWAFGLGNKNDILEHGEMMDPKYGGAGNFASTGGWTIADGNAMDHYSMHQFVILTKNQQELVDRVSKTIFRPCCKNSTHFPDCNHGMAMLGLLELMAANNVSEQEMSRVALEVNKLWFPEVYGNTAPKGCSV